MDGTLFDTKYINFYSYSKALKDEGFDLDYDYFSNRCFGRNYQDFLPGIIGIKDEKLLRTIHEKKQIIYAQNLKCVRINEHLLHMLMALKEQYFLSIVTTASRKNTLDILNYFEMKQWFDLIISREDVENVKPDPEGFLKAINHFNVLNDNTIIFEDSEQGIEAAQKSGCKIFRVISM